MNPIPRFCHKYAPRTSPNAARASLAGELTARTLQELVQAVECYPNRPYPHINHLESSISVEPHCVPARTSPLFLSEPPGRIPVCLRPRRRFSPLWTFEKNIDRRVPNFNGPNRMLPRNRCHFTHHSTKIKLFGKADMELAVTPCQRRKAPSMSLLQSGTIIFDEEFSLVDETTAPRLPVKRSTPMEALPHSTADSPITKQQPASSLAKISDKVEALPTKILESKSGPEKQPLLVKTEAAKTVSHKPLSEKKPESPEVSLADSHALMPKAVVKPPAGVLKKPPPKLPEEPLPKDLGSKTPEVLVETIAAVPKKPPPKAAKDLGGKPPEVLGETLAAVPKKPPPKIAKESLPKDLEGKTLEILEETLAAVPKKPPPKIAKESLPKDLEGKTLEVLGETLAAVPKKPPPKIAKESLPKDLEGKTLEILGETLAAVPKKPQIAKGLLTKDLGQQFSLLPKSVSIISPLNEPDIRPPEHEDIATTSALPRKSFSAASLKKEVDKQSSIVDFITSPSISVQGLESPGSTKEIEKPKLTASAELAEQQKSGGIKLQSLSALRRSLESKTLMKSPEIGKEIPEGSSRFFDKIVGLITPGHIEKSVTPATVPTVESKYSGSPQKPRSVATMKTLGPESGRKFDSYFSISKSASMNDSMPKAALKAIPEEERQVTGVIPTPLSATVIAKKPASEEPEESRNVAASVAGGVAAAVLIGSGFVGTIAAGPKQEPLVESSSCNGPREPLKVTGGSEEPKHKASPQKPPPKKVPLPSKAKLPMIVSIGPNKSNTPATGPVVHGIPDLSVPQGKPLIEDRPGKDMTESAGPMPPVQPKPASVTPPLGGKTVQDGQAQAIPKSESEDSLVCSEKLPHIKKIVAMKSAKRVLKFTESVERSQESSESLEMDSVRLAELKEAGKQVTPQDSPDAIPIGGNHRNVKAASPIAKPGCLETEISLKKAPLAEEDSSSHEGVTKPGPTLKKQAVTIDKVLVETENVHPEKPMFEEVGPNSAGLLEAEQQSREVPATERSEVLEPVVIPVMRPPEAEPAVLACEPDNPSPESTEKVDETATIVALAALPVLGATAVGSVTSAGYLGDVDKPSITGPVTFDETSERRSSLLRRKELLKRAREMLNEVEPAKAEGAKEPAEADELATSTQAAMGGAATSGNMKKGLDTPDDWGIAIDKIKHTGSGGTGILLSTAGSSGQLNSPGRSSGRMKSQSPSQILGSPRRLGGAATGVLKNLLKKDRTT